jgi:hypothetical protein
MSDNNSSLITKINIYKHPAAFLLSGTVIVLYIILNLIEVNGIIKSYNILDVDSTTRSSLIFSYLSGYYIFILKLFISILTLFVIVTIIRIAILVILSLFSIKLEMKGGGEDEDHLMEAVKSNFRLFLSFFIIPSIPFFILIFLVIIPLIFLFSIYRISLYYDQEKIKDENINQAPSILNTNHHFIYFIMCVLITIAIIYVFVLFYLTYKKQLLSEPAITPL